MRTGGLGYVMCGCDVALVYVELGFWRIFLLEGVGRIEELFRIGRLVVGF